MDDRLLTYSTLLRIDDHRPGLGALKSRLLIAPSESPEDAASYVVRPRDPADGRRGLRSTTRRIHRINLRHVLSEIKQAQYIHAAPVPTYKYSHDA